MTWQLLIVEPASSPLEGFLGEGRQKTPDLICEHVGWQAGLGERIRASRSDLVVMVALPPSTADAASFIRSLAQSPITMPTLGIVPDDADGELVQLASQFLGDFIIAPVRSCELRHRIARILGDVDRDGSGVEACLLRELTLAGLVGRNPAFLHTVGRIPLAARSKGPVLIVGETGTGKELCARAIHSLGPRRDFPFIPVDCATLPDLLFESELFGHVRGAFTDARYDHKGLVALADGGTLFLDEVDSLSLSVQPKLLRFLQERAYRPLGSERIVKIDVSLVVATNSDLQELVREKRFRADLFYRLNVFRLFLVPLRERRDDIALLARHFVERICAENGIAPKTLIPATVRELNRYDWPGNVRELYNVIQRAVIFSEGAQILPAHIDDANGQSADGSGPVFDSFRAARSRAIESFEKRYVEDLMRECDGNISRAARVALKDRRAFGRLVKRYGIRRDRL